MYLVVAVVINQHKDSPAVVSVSMMIIQVKIWHSLASRPRDPSALLTATQVTAPLAGNITVIDANKQLNSPPLIRPMDPI